MANKKYSDLVERLNEEGYLQVCGNDLKGNTEMYDALEFGEGRMPIYTSFQEVQKIDEIVPQAYAYINGSNNYDLRAVLVPVNIGKEVLKNVDEEEYVSLTSRADVKKKPSNVLNGSPVNALYNKGKLVGFAFSPEATEKYLL